MAESTARVERTAHASETLYFPWDVPEKPLAIRVGLDLVDRLDREVVASFRSVNERGSEIGGILLGRFVPGTPLVAAVTDYERIACDYSRGPLYRLAGADKERFDAALRQHAGQDLAVVGMFRSNTRRGLSLDPEDIAFLGDRFPDPRQFMLLIRPFATKPSVAGFFIRENGAIHGEASYLEFPFARAELLSSSAPLNVAAAAPAPPPAAPATPKSASRAQVVPIAPRRDVPAAPPRAPAPEAKPTVPPEAKPADQSAAPPAPEPKPAAPEPPKPAVQAAAPVPEPPPPAATAAVTGPVPEPPSRMTAPDSLPAPNFGLASEEAPAPNGKKWIWIAGGSVGALVLASLLFFYPGFLVRRGGAPVAVAQPPANLELRVERNAGQLVLTWNRESELIKTATKAVLTIADGPQRENIDLDLAQLRNGSVIYSPVTSDVNFRLDVTSSKPELSRSELVRVLGTKPSPMPPVGSQNANNSDAQPAQPGDVQADGQPSENAAPAPPRKNLSTQSLAQRLSPAAESELPEPPSISGVPAQHQTPGLPVNAGLPAPPIAAPAPPAAPAPQTTQARVNIGGKVQEAKLVKRVEPIYPTIARQSRVAGNVEIDATIAKDGTVRVVRAVSGHPLLQQAAADAVRKWIYTPTLLNGTPVEVVTRVNVGFTLTR